MKKIILAGHVACGKTTLCQCLNGMEMQYKKTQALEVINTTIDTPGEYLQSKHPPRRKHKNGEWHKCNYHLRSSYRF